MHRDFFFDEYEGMEIDIGDNEQKLKTYINKSLNLSFLRFFHSRSKQKRFFH